MAIDLGNETITVTRSERTWRVELFCERGQDYVLRGHRETVATGSDGSVSVARDIAPVEASLSAIATRSFAVDDPTNPGSKITLTGAQAAAFIAGVVDRLRQDQIAAAQS